jgi:hypothetical protein
MKSVDVFANALVWDLNYGVTEAAVEARVSVVDLGSPSSINRLDEAAKSAGITIIPHCGLDPGIDRILISYGVSKLDTVDEVTVNRQGNSVLQCSHIGSQLAQRPRGQEQELVRSPPNPWRRCDMEGLDWN